MDQTINLLIVIVIGGCNAALCASAIYMCLMSYGAKKVYCHSVESCPNTEWREC